LKNGLAYLGKTLSDIDFIINTHYHFDHIGSNTFVKQRSNAQLLIHEADRIAIENFDAYVDRYGMPEELELKWRAALKMMGFKELAPDSTFSDGDLLPGQFRVIHTPGHASGHCCFYKAKILLSGDIDLISPWLGNTSCNLADYLNSLERLKTMKIKILLPSHGHPVSRNIPERLEAFRQKFLDREVRLYRLMPTEATSLSQITTRLFNTLSESHRNRQGLFTFHFGKISCLNFLIHLESLGKVEKTIKDGEAYWQKIG
jgi:hydroxyacylglutathione hydrolase